MKYSQTGFTLVELVIVIVILGLLSAIAVPKFIDLSSDAKTSATNSVAGSLSSANAINYAARSENSSKGSAVSNCSNGSLLLNGGLPSGYTITAATVAVGVTVTCTLTGPGSTTASFIMTGII